MRARGPTDWRRVLVIGLLAIGLTYAVVDRTQYETQARTRASLSSQAADAFYGLFMARADSIQRAALQRRGAGKEALYVPDPVLAANRVLQDAAQRTGVHINSVTPEERTVDAPASMKATPLDIDLSASYPSLVRFIALLEGAPLLVVVKDVDIRTGELPAAPLSGKLSLTVITLARERRR